MSGVSESNVSSQTSRGTKRKWVPEEDATLVSCMVDLHNVGTFNADTGFKAGYLNELEKMLEKALPNAMLKARPNIELRIRLLKRDWPIVYDMLNGQNNSGFGWDEHRQLVFAEDAVWNSYLNSHKEAGQFKHRSFPYYDQLTAIYAKDRATGKDAQTAADVIKEINVEDNRNQIETKGVPHLQRRKKRILMQVIIFLLHFMMLPLYWRKTCRPLANKSVGVLPPMW
ncbi:uncharacterized protein LOC105793881 [Gossypium raimondii]|uniref:uncharacterized protein LOC105793881 n=1 Tax=Gossypium raimondii TaxID=29730 RepID=UPI00227B57C5|nr:uncharacterized protein LOC105793881 [Gossypium raimondii]